MIPPWVVDLLERAKADAWTGTLSISYRSGEARCVKREDVVLPPVAKPAPAPPVCPRNCGPMEEKDYGNLFVCPTCGAKRTRGQLGSPG